MTTTASLAEVRQAGVAIEAEEAVAIAQQLIAALRHGGVDAAEAPYGPPTPATVVLSGDGSVACRTCETTPAVSEVAILLQAMLPAESRRVPGGLRYTIARALLDVDVPPFDSLDDFAETLARYERGARDQAVGRVLERLDARRALVPVSAADRRRHPRAAQLRRALREADARLYLQKLATEAVTVRVAPRAPQPRSIRGAAACVAAGLLMIAAGEFIDGGHRPVPASPVAAAPPVVAHEMSHAVALVRGEAGVPIVDRHAARDERRSAPPAVKGASDVARAQPSRGVTRRASPSGVTTRRASSPGVLDRLRLNWLRTVFTSS